MILVLGLAADPINYACMVEAPKMFRANELSRTSIYQFL